jgi:6-pyruvoyltetrahydropterin/6-carboxytetrahydropterin synthase
MVFLTRKEHFNGAHCLYNEMWSEEKNKEVFGKCSNRNFHGHNFDVYVTVKGAPHPDTGFVMNAHILSRIIKKEVVERLDHKNFNLDVPELTGNFLHRKMWRFKFGIGLNHTFRAANYIV